MTNPWSESSSKVSILYIDIDHREIDDIKSSVAGVQELFEWQRRKYCLLAHPLQASILYIYILLSFDHSIEAREWHIREICSFLLDFCSLSAILSRLWWHSSKGCVYIHYSCQQWHYSTNLYIQSFAEITCYPLHCLGGSFICTECKYGIPQCRPVN